LADGYLVVAPPKPVTVGADTFAGWWRVDPATGHTLGIGATGWGQAMPEWAVTVLTIGTAAATAFLFQYLWCKLTTGGGDDMARGCPSSSPDRRMAALDFFIVPLQAADTACLWSALEAAFLSVGFGLAGGLEGGGFAGEPGGRPGQPGGGAGEPGGGGEPPPDLGKTAPDLGDTLEGPPPSVGGRSGQGGKPPSSAGGESGGEPGASGTGADTDDAALDAALKRAWDAQERGDEQGLTDAIRDMARITSPQRYLKYIPPPGEPAGAGPPKPPPPVVPPPPPPAPCVGTGCDTSPMAKSVLGMSGALDVVKGGKP
jgi:hypothetical protein